MGFASSQNWMVFSTDLKKQGQRPETLIRLKSIYAKIGLSKIDIMEVLYAGQGLATTAPAWVAHAMGVPWGML